MFFVVRLKRVVLFVIFVIMIIYLYNILYPKIKETLSLPSTGKLIVIDAGHGGFDPGAIGVTGSEEKKVNLAIALKVQGLLEQNGANVILTRSKDEATGNTKKEDMKERKNIRDQGKGDIFLSIHLNSYPEEQYKGAQVFYPKGDEKSKIMAESIQSSLIKVLDKNNTRMAKAIEDIYLLKNSTAPSNVIECGFLSNYDEEKQLITEEYQNKIAWAIYIGLTEYMLNTNSSNHID